MNIKRFVKTHAPKSFIPLLKLLYKTYQKSRRPKQQPLTVEQKKAAEERLQSLRAEAMKYLPYYQDELSREILSDRLEYCATWNSDIFMYRVEKMGMKFHNFLSSKGEERVVLIYDNNGSEFQHTKRVLSLLENADTIRMITLKDFLNGAEIADSDVIVSVLTKPLNRLKFAVKFITRNIHARVIESMHLFFSRTDLQYFDMFSPVDDEIIIDAGAYDGATAIKFLEWGRGKVKHVYSFEFDPINAISCEKNLKPYADKVTLVKKGTWDKDEVMHVGTDGTTSSRVSYAGSTEVHLTTIDSVVQDERVTFIKMDVEGAELKSLMGAHNTITKNHPRLAICIYHKPEDLYEIPGYILSLVPEYKFYLRHYSSVSAETVLYAYCDE